MWRLVPLVMIAAGLQADVTVRYQNVAKTSAPSPISDSNSPDAIRVKGGMGQITSSGFTLIADFKAQRLSVLDAWHLKYAAIPIAEYASRLSSTVPASTAAAMK